MFNPQQKTMTGCNPASSRKRIIGPRAKKEKRITPMAFLRFPDRLFQSSWNSGIFFFSFSFPKWKPTIKAEEIKRMLSNALKRDFIVTFHILF